LRDGTAINSPANSTTTGSGTVVDSGSGTTSPTVLSANTPYTLHEVASGTTRLGQYRSALSCTDAANANRALALDTAFSLQTTDVITCTLTNAPAPATLRVTQTVISPVPPNLLPPFSQQYTSTNGWGPQNITNTRLNAPVSTATLPLAANTTQTTLSTTLPDTRWFVSRFSCSDAAASVSGNPGGVLVSVSSPSVTIPAVFLLPGADLRCSIFLGHVTP
jgi:hypothetical protein